ncbi:hypothetical protein CFIMG_007703RA00001 [Ceratocystis fimbriata CBS 114723]|uniref:Uncharacterized protein n=1 Tax=Ceratocystis fimbriata CBS 114723 TaxID=1035309 RepID=A0A2C5WUE7_9PEZI|nr:hypothetical protein CFIMG_007703RA00001 [Ceratocystis fimbriata CBS 114723]
MHFTAIAALLAAAVVMAIPSPTLEDEPSPVEKRAMGTRWLDYDGNNTEIITDGLNDINGGFASAIFVASSDKKEERLYLCHYNRKQ